jgi:protein-S-isoprenylcysteine O-methyltransferase Ste14
MVAAGPWRPVWSAAVSVWRHVRAIALLPGMVTIPVPAAILAVGGIDVGWGFDGPWSALPVVAGAALIGFGLALWYWTVNLFARQGEGTLAPWDPTRRLVLLGPYRHVRNPMITGVLLVLGGEAALFGSLGVLAWAGAFFLVNAVWFPLVEEPGLARRFGSDYEAYKRNVPRWVPRRTPWDMD